MKITILQFSGKDGRDDIIHEALQSAGIRVRRVKSLSALHVYLATGLFDAVLVSGRTTDQFCMRPSRHLWEHHSSLAIMTWREKEGGGLEVAVHALPVSGTGMTIARANDRDARLDIVRRCLEGIGHADAPEKDGTACERTSEYRAARTGEGKHEEIAFPAEIDIRIHRKLRAILGAISEAGAKGASPDAIGETVWKGDKRDRKKDIQIYVCRLRRLLDQAFPGRYRIKLAEGRYTLEKPLAADQEA